MENINKKKILIFGGSGFLSSYLFERLQKSFSLSVAYNKDYIKHNKFKYFKIIKISQSCINNIIDNSKPNIIINTIAYTDIDKINRKKNLSKDLNINLPKIISNICLDWFFERKISYIGNHKNKKYITYKEKLVININFNTKYNTE